MIPKNLTEIRDTYKFTINSKQEFQNKYNELTLNSLHHKKFKQWLKDNKHLYNPYEKDDKHQLYQMMDWIDHETGPDIVPLAGEYIFIPEWNSLHFFRPYPNVNEDPSNFLDNWDRPIHETRIFLDTSPLIRATILFSIEDYFEDYFDAHIFDLPDFIDEYCVNMVDLINNINSDIEKVVKSQDYFGFWIPQEPNLNNSKKKLITNTVFEAVGPSQLNFKSSIFLGHHINVKKKDSSSNKTYYDTQWRFFLTKEDRDWYLENVKKYLLTKFSQDLVDNYIG